MQFESAMRLLFGNKAYQIAGTEANPKHRLQWLQRTQRRLLRVVDSLGTTPRHKQMLMSELESVSEALKGQRDPSWELVYRLFRLSMVLFGFRAGARCYTPSYWQTAGQYHTGLILEDKDHVWYQEQKDAISIRRHIAKLLKNEGHDDFKIALVLNTSEYAVKQLRSNTPLQRTRQKQARR